MLLQQWLAVIGQLMDGTKGSTLLQHSPHSIITWSLPLVFLCAQYIAGSPVMHHEYSARGLYAQILATPQVSFGMFWMNQSAACSLDIRLWEREYGFRGQTPDIMGHMISMIWNTPVVITAPKKGFPVWPNCGMIMFNTPASKRAATACSLCSAGMAYFSMGWLSCRRGAKVFVD